MLIFEKRLVFLLDGNLTAPEPSTLAILGNFSSRMVLLLLNAVLKLLERNFVPNIVGLCSQSFVFVIYQYFKILSEALIKVCITVINLLTLCAIVFKSKNVKIVPPNTAE